VEVDLAADARSAGRTPWFGCWLGLSAGSYEDGKWGIVQTSIKDAPGP
jgi:hypothetical protein